MLNPLQEDYVRFPKSTRGTPRQVKIWKRAADNGVYHIGEFEQRWVDLQPYFLSKGYRLRPRYTPGWEPVWIDTDINPRTFEESVICILPNVIDAKRESDGKVVAIKWIPHAAYTRHEVEVMRFLSSDALRSDPQNHCNPLLDTFANPNDPNGIFIVTPWLSDFVYLPLQTVGDVVDLLTQLLEGLVFMHKNGVAHRDCTNLNIMQDTHSMFPGIETHPIKHRWSVDMQTEYTQRPRPRAAVRYYFIDFGVSLKFSGPGPHLATGTVCRDQTAPELSATVPFDPFQLDVYLVGNHVMEMLTKYSNLEFLRPFLSELTKRVPADRPTAREALAKIKYMIPNPFALTYRARLRLRDEDFVETLFLDLASVVSEVHSKVTSLIEGGAKLLFGGVHL